MSPTYAERVLAALGASNAVMGVLDSPTVAVLVHVTRHTEAGDIREDACPCGRGVEGLPVDDLGRPVLEQLGAGQYVSSVRHTLADLVRDVIGTGDNV